MKRRRQIAISAILLFVMVVGGAVWWRSTAWKRDLTIRFIGCFSSTLSDTGNNYYLYEITNNNIRSLKNVYAEIVNHSPKDWTYEDYVSHKLRVGETKEYKIYSNKIKKEAEGKNFAFFLIDPDIKRIKYKYE